jgi:hypothetical protein
MLFTLATLVDKRPPHRAVFFYEHLALAAILLRLRLHAWIERELPAQLLDLSFARIALLRVALSANHRAFGNCLAVGF